MKHLVFLVEEPSMKGFLDTLLPRIIPENITYDILPHEGKSDLERSIPRKLRGYLLPGYNVHFVILRDQHGGDCFGIKQKLQQLCQQSGRPDALIRIVCRELESWYLGDLAALEAAFGERNLSDKQQTRTYRDPDRLTNAADIMHRLVPGFIKSNGYQIASHIDLESNCSKIFQVFLSGVRRIVSESAQLRREKS